MPTRAKIPTIKRAKPCSVPCPMCGGADPWPGMALRNYFAAKAMAALIAKLPLLDREGEHGVASTPDQIKQMRKDIAECSFLYADAMLAERARP